MRPIDGDALLNTYKVWLPQLTSLEDAGDRNGVETCIAVLESAPTLEVEPVRHGRWEKGGYACGETEWKCSVCGKTEWRTSCSRMKFCMFCGAKMDAGGA